LDSCACFAAARGDVTEAEQGGHVAWDCVMMLLLDLEPGPWELTGALDVSDAAAQFGGYAAWPPRVGLVNDIYRAGLLEEDPFYMS